MGRGGRRRTSPAPRRGRPRAASQLRSPRWRYRPGRRSHRGRRSPGWRRGSSRACPGRRSARAGAEARGGTGPCARSTRARRCRGRGPAPGTRGPSRLAPPPHDAGVADQVVEPAFVTAERDHQEADSEQDRDPVHEVSSKGAPDAHATPVNADHGPSPAPASQPSSATAPPPPCSTRRLRGATGHPDVKTPRVCNEAQKDVSSRERLPPDCRPPKSAAATRAATSERSSPSRTNAPNRIQNPAGVPKQHPFG